MKKITEEQILEIRKSRLEGLSLEKISKKYELNRETVSKYTADICLTKEQKYQMVSSSQTKYNYNSSAFSNGTEISLYLLGAFITDGHISYDRLKNSQTAVLTSKDLDWLTSIAEIVCPGKPVSKSKLHDAYMLRLHDKKIVEWLVFNGCKPRKSLDVKFPNLPDLYLKDFIRGCMDGDGCFCIYKSGERKVARIYSYISSASKPFVEKMKDELSKLEIDSTITECKLCNSVIQGRKVIAKNNLWRLHLSKKNTIKLINAIYSEGCLCLERKHEKCRQIIKLAKI
jgi:intein-encoded DNA endonuclease-like protein